MVDDPNHNLIPELDDAELARCRRLRSELRNLIAISRATIARSRELVAVARASYFPGLAAASPATRADIGLPDRTG